MNTPEFSRGEFTEAVWRFNVPSVQLPKHETDTGTAQLCYDCLSFSVDQGKFSHLCADAWHVFPWLPSDGALSVYSGVCGRSPPRQLLKSELRKNKETAPRFFGGNARIRFVAEGWM